MLRLLFLIILISGVSTRGVPKADDNAELKPKGIETDQKDHSSEHVNLTDCEDCKQATKDVDVEDDSSLKRHHDKADISNDGEGILKTTLKPKTTLRPKPFLKFHRIRVSVSRDRNTNRKTSRRNKGKRLHTSGTTNTQHKKDREPLGTEHDRAKLSSHSKKLADTRDNSNNNPEESNAQLRRPETTTKIGSNDNSDENSAKPKEAKRKAKTDSQYKTEEAENKNKFRLSNTELGKNEANAGTNVKKPYGKSNLKKTADKNEKKNFATHGSINAVKNDMVTDDKEMQKVEKINKANEKAEQTGIVLAEKSGLLKKDQINGHIQNGANGIKTGITVEGVQKGTTYYILDNKVDKTKKQNVMNTQTEKFKSKANSNSGNKSEGNKKTVSTRKHKNKKNVRTKTVRGKTRDSTTDKSEESKKETHSVSTEKPKDEKNSVDHVIPKSSRDRWSRKGLSQVPDVERLERRLHPTLDAPVKDIIQSMKNMLQLIKSSLSSVDTDFKMIANTTRWKYMVGVRNQLTELAQKNDEIYDVVMDASLLTKQIYRQAHERRHPRPNIEAAAVAYRTKLNTNMHPQIRKNFHAAQMELEKINLLKEQINGIRKIKDSLSDEEMRIHHLVRDRLPMRSMHDLYRRADQTIRLLSAQPVSRFGETTRLYGHMKNDSALNMRRARELIVEGFDVLTHAKRVLLENKQKVHEHSRIVRSRLPAGTVSDMPFDARRMDLFVAWDEANHHANSLSESAAEIHMKFVPLIMKAKDVIANSAGVGFKKQLEQSLSEMKDYVKKLMKTLDTIRVIVGDEGILKDRCEDIEGSGLFSDDEDTPIDCDPYITIAEGSGIDIDGSGEVDDTFVDIELSMTNNSINVTAEKASADIDITKLKNSSVNTEVTKPTEPSIDRDTTKAIKVVVDKTKSQTPPTAVTIDGTDDEDIAQELKRKSTENTSPSTTTTQSTTVKVTTESPEGSEEDFVFDVFGWFNDQPDDDSVILGEVDDTIGIDPVSSNMTLNEHIRERLYNYSQDSKKLLDDAKSSKTKMEEISLTWEKVKKSFATVENSTLKAKALISKWKAEKAYFKAVHDRVKSVNDDVNLKIELVQEQCTDAVNIANKKLKDMTKVYEKQSEKAKTSADPADVNQAVSQVKVVLDDVREITRLKQLYPTPCSTLERLDKKIRSNITELRKKIERAKLIASTLQIAVSVPKTESLEFPISDQSDDRHPLTSHVQMMLKHTGSDGRLMSMHVGESESLSLEVKTDAVTVVQSIDGDESTYPLYSDEIADTWYLIQLQRFAASYNFTMVGEKGILGKVGLPNTVDKQRTFNRDLLPTSLLVGATGEDLSACVLGLEINGRSVNMYDTSDNKSLPTPCPSQGRWMSHQRSLLLDGSGYAAISLSDIRSFRTLQSIKFSFNPRSDGTVIFLQSERMATTIDVYIEKGMLVVFIHHRGFETKLKSTSEVYSNNQVLEISFKSGRTKGANVVLNGKTNVFKTAKGGKREKLSNSNNIFIGGISGKSSSMVGCIKSLEVNGEEIPFNNIHEAEGHSYGSCRETECVIFDDDSVPIELTDLSSVQIIHVSVRRGSLGPVLQFSKHKEKFNLEISLNTEGVHVEETVKENSEDFSLDGESDFIVIVIQEDTEEKSVTVTVDGDSEEFSYGGDAWGWGNGDKEDDGPVSYSVSVAASSEESPALLGSIQNLIIDGRPIDLLKYEESSKLARCTVDPVPKQTKETKPDAIYKGMNCQ